MLGVYLGSGVKIVKELQVQVSNANTNVKCRYKYQTSRP